MEQKTPPDTAVMNFGFGGPNLGDPYRFGESVPQTAAQADVCAPLAQRMTDRRVAALCDQFPGLSINPPPLIARAVVLDAGVAREVRLPDGCQMIRLTCKGKYAGASAADFWMSIGTKPRIPASSAELDTDPYAVCSPEGWIAVTEIRTIWLLAEAQAVVSIHCHVQQ